MILRETPLFAAKAARQRFLPLCSICFGTHIDKCRKFTLFRYAFHKAQCAKAKSAVFAFAREYRNRARSPLFGKVASMRQIECAYRKASFSDAQFDYGKRGLSFCVTLSGAAAQPPRSRTGLCHAARWSDTDSVAKQTAYGSRGFLPKISPLAALGRNDTGGHYASP